MLKSLIQIENTNSAEFRKEIVSDFETIAKNLVAKMQTNTQEEFLTRPQVAKMLSISEVTLWSYTKKGIIPAVRFGRNVRYEKKEVLRAMQKMNNFED